MLDSIWQLLRNYDLKTDEIRAAIRELIIVDDGGNIVGGMLEPMANFPLIGGILSAFGGFAPAEGLTQVVETTTETIA